MMVILRQGLTRISRCSLGVVKLCLSFFLWLYQFIMRQNDQNTPEAVEHDYLEVRVDQEVFDEGFALAGKSKKEREKTVYRNSFNQTIF